MNQKGEATLLSIMIILILSGLVLLCSLELKKNFQQLKKRTHLFLCVKETKGELGQYMKFMGQTNWAIENIYKAQLIALLFPPTAPIAMHAGKLKKALLLIQNGSILLYFKKIQELKSKNCPLDPKLLLTPFEINVLTYKRDLNDAAILRKKKWNYYFLTSPYLINIEFDATNYKSSVPAMKYKVSEKGAKLRSLSSFAF